MSPAAPLDRLRALLRHRTVSFHRDRAPFDAFRRDVARFYPRLAALADPGADGDRGILIRIPGRSGSNRATVLLAHYDVVPADDQVWRSGPFDAELSNGAVTGRGAIDDKGRLVAILEAAEAFLLAGSVPADDVYLAFGDDEETAGRTAERTARLLAGRGTEIALLLDEGPGVVSGSGTGSGTGFGAGFEGPLALIGVSERGSAGVTVSVRHEGGHASAPPPGYATELLVLALAKIVAERPPFRLTPTVRAFLESLAAQAPPSLRAPYLEALEDPVLAERLLRRAGDEYASWGLDTEAVTRLSGSAATNILPTLATADIDLRVAEGTSLDEALASIRARVADERVRVELVGGGEASSVSRPYGSAFERIARALHAIDAEAIAVPASMMGATDARFFAPRSPFVYRFSPFAWLPGQRGLLHAPDEYLTVDQWSRAIEFTRRLLDES